MPSAASASFVIVILSAPNERPHCANPDLSAGSRPSVAARMTPSARGAPRPARRVLLVDSLLGHAYLRSCRPQRSLLRHTRVTQADEIGGFV
jgi:hypothetical protein